MLWKLGLQVAAYALFLLWTVMRCAKSLFLGFRIPIWSWKNLKIGIVQSLTTQSVIRCTWEFPGNAGSQPHPHPRPAIRIRILTIAAGDLYAQQSLRSTVESTACACTAVSLLPHPYLNSAGSMDTTWTSQFDAGGGMGFWCMPKMQNSHREEQVLFPMSDNQASGTLGQWSPAELPLLNDSSVLELSTSSYVQGCGCVRDGCTLIHVEVRRKRKSFQKDKSNRS